MARARGRSRPWHAPAPAQAARDADPRAQQVLLRLGVVAEPRRLHVVAAREGVWVILHEYGGIACDPHLHGQGEG